ncbi:hypothetical protein [uncultured Candidatus Kuenenia sp.]|uniref:hypothetical protein n=1 Tax=uncultured Candidatus Kuenenia sp. TaxID=1048336 RepID=UPI0003050638|nr:hypothetical protein [uncultured Candidatus Kuenenia sp.]
MDNLPKDVIIIRDPLRDIPVVKDMNDSFTRRCVEIIATAKRLWGDSSKCISDNEMTDSKIVPKKKTPFITLKMGRKDLILTCFSPP